MPNFFKNRYFDFIVNKISHQHTIKTQPKIFNVKNMGINVVIKGMSIVLFF